MNTRISELKQLIVSKEHHKLRRDLDINLAEEYKKQALEPIQRMANRLVFLLKNETPVFIEGERIAFTRTIRKLPDIFTAEEWNGIKANHFIHELGYVCNITPDYEKVIKTGLLVQRNHLLERHERCVAEQDIQGSKTLKAMLDGIDAVLDLAERYRQAAKAKGYGIITDILSRIPKYGAKTFHEALQFFRILHFTLWYEGEYHNTIGRFDQYMYPYLEAELKAGIIDEESAFELLEEFFLMFNRDSDLYPGVQQGDNGQSMVLGGLIEGNQDGFNLLSKMCLEASRDLKLIDPKINLRVNSKTKTEIYDLGTELTKEGLGFPQYSNDDIIIPGLIKKGYAPKDARNYSVAACWETIIPGAGMDIPNIDALSFPHVVDICLHNTRPKCDTFEAFFDTVKGEIAQESRRMADNIKSLWMIPAPFMSLLMDGCVENARDISLGCKYNNFGFHGTGLSTATDSLAAIKQYVFDEKSISAERIIEAVDSDFGHDEELLEKLRFHTPKFGNNDVDTNAIASDLLDTFAASLDGLTNERGGIFRAGTGSAMYYIWHAREIGASPDGRRKAEPLSANYSPSLFARIKGPISVIESFTKPKLVDVINGGPLTMEFHETLFRDDESKHKVAMLVESFIKLKGAQLQLNAVNRETLLDAQKHPENYPSLIVRVWGWSAYFVELDKEYQNHIIRRNEY